MSTQRELFFECTLSSHEGERTAHVRAWDPVEAESLFREGLALSGVEIVGTITIKSHAGFLRRRTGYQPLHQADDASAP